MKKLIFGKTAFKKVQHKTLVLYTIMQKRRDSSVKIIDFILKNVNNLPMILLDTFKKDEILKSTRSFEKGDPSIVELVVHAFYLLEQLSVNKLDFVFKGGTALMLYF